jgi:hypothetical protein
MQQAQLLHPQQWYKNTDDITDKAEKSMAL